MQLPPDSDSPTDISRDGSLLSSPRQSYPTPQIACNQDVSMPGYPQPPTPSNHKFPAQTTSGTNMHLRTSLTQKFAIVMALLLTIGVVLTIPLLLIQQFIYTNNFIIKEPYSKSNQAIANTNSMPIPSPTKAIFPPMGQIMTGVSMPGDNADTIDNFEKDAGKNVSVILLYQAWGATDGTQNFPVDWARSVRKHGAMPLITWEPWVHQDYPKGNNEPNYTLKNIIAGKFDNYIRQWSNAAKAWKNPFFYVLLPR